MIDLIGKKFNRLTVIKQSNRNKHGQIQWLCECDCGKKTIVPGHCLRKGNTRSCGCLQREIIGKLFTKHGHNSKDGKSKVYQAWDDMTQRCTNPNFRQYKDYGGRGIIICERWKKFTNFLRDMGEPTTNKHTLDRINNNGNYCKSNCHWATRKQQQRNKRNNHLITFGGKTQCLFSWAEETGIKYQTIQGRLGRGWSIEKTLTTQVS